MQAGGSIFPLSLGLTSEHAETAGPFLPVYTKSMLERVTLVQGTPGLQSSFTATFDADVPLMSL